MTLSFVELCCNKRYLRRMKNRRQLFFEIVQIGLGVLLASIGLKGFLMPNSFLDGGATGIAILISEVSDFNLSLTVLVISVPFIVLAWFTLSKPIVIKSILSILLLSVFMYFENFSTVTEDKLLISIFGGLFLGAGMGLTIKNGAVLDGTEILGIYFNNRLGISIGKTILFFNVILFGITALVLTVEIAMYSILTFLVTSKVIDLLIEGFEDYVGLMIVSQKSTAIEQGLMDEIGAGMTLYSGARGYGKRGKQSKGEIIHTVINRIDIRRTYNLIETLDPEAFIIEFDVNNIKGGILRKFLTRQGMKETIAKIK